MEPRLRLITSTVQWARDNANILGQCRRCFPAPPPYHPLAHEAAATNRQRCDPFSNANTHKVNPDTLGVSARAQLFHRRPEPSFREIYLCIPDGFRMPDRSRLYACPLMHVGRLLVFPGSGDRMDSTYDGVTFPPPRGFVDTGPARRLAREGWSPRMRRVAWAQDHVPPTTKCAVARIAVALRYGYVSSRWAAKLYIDDIPVAHCARNSPAAMLLLAGCSRKAVNSDTRHSARRGVSAST